ncbi:MAG: OmpA family protein [Treponema sp.]|jgi:outer membrane protein OmpA-like peptidoglycan-associated protein|nr:OmpA family protein [Treponema sp.]
MIVRVLCVLLCFLTIGFLFAQSAAVEIETLLASEAVTYAQAARFILEAADVAATPNPGAAFIFAAEQNWLPKRAAPQDAARLDDISLLMMRAFEIKGGVMFSIFKNPHYAYRELTYKRIVYGRTDPAMQVTGERLLAYISRILAVREAAALSVQEEVVARREAIIAEISAMLEQQQVANTTVEATKEGITITLSNIQFLADSAVLTEGEMSKIRDIAGILKNISGVKLLVTGHTAQAGTREGQRRISQERAESVAALLVSLGACKAENVTAVGYGADRPVASNATPEGMAANRRVEITILE